MRTILCLLLLSLTTPLLASDPVAHGTEISVDSVVRLMNHYRAIEGLPPLRVDSRLEQAAGDRIVDMFEQSYYAHTDPTGRAPFVWYERRGYDFSYAAENLARGFETTKILVESWMESPGHRANILSPNVDDVGVAIADGSPTGRAPGKLVVVMFGRQPLEKIQTAR